MRRKQYAVSLGLATPGKGRMSREALEAVAKAESEGMVFDDAKGTPAPKVVRETPKPVTVKRESGPVATHERTDSVMGTTLRYEMDQMFVGVDSNGKTHTVNGRQACSCGYSLVGHVCNMPNALIGSPLERISVRPK
jgi:hypothetical protein